MHTLWGPLALWYPSYKQTKEEKVKDLCTHPGKWQSWWPYWVNCHPVYPVGCTQCSAPSIRPMEGLTNHLIITIAASSPSTLNNMESGAGTGWLKDEEPFDRWVACNDGWRPEFPVDVGSQRFSTIDLKEASNQKGFWGELKNSGQIKQEELQNDRDWCQWCSHRVYWLGFLQMSKLKQMWFQV